MWALEPTLNETKMQKRCDNATPTPPITQKGMRAYARRPGDSALGLARGECAPKRLACHRCFRLPRRRGGGGGGPDGRLYGQWGSPF